MLADVEKRPSKAHTQRRRNEKLAASAKAKEHGKENMCRRNTSYGRTPLGCRLWGFSQFWYRKSCLVLKNCFVQEKLRKSSGPPNFPKEEKASKRLGLKRCMWPMPQNRWKTSQSKFA